MIFLDEPTTGLDPAKREEVWAMVRTLVAQGVTVLLTTQYLEEADALADEISVIDHGRVIAQGTPDELKQRRRRSDPRGACVRPVACLGGDRDDARVGVVQEVEPRSPPGCAERRGRRRHRDDRHGRARARDAGITVTELSLRLPSLDEVFFSLTGRPRPRTTDARDKEVAG